jgi:hypothetical protein
MANDTAPANAIVQFLATLGTGTQPPLDFNAFRAKVHLYAALPMFEPQNDLASVTMTTGSPIAPWLGAVERRLNASVGVDGSKDLQNGTHLSKEIVAAATKFFAATSYMLPAEPYLYAIPGGELVAEFNDGSDGRMTVVISDETVLALTIVGGQTVYKEISIKAQTSATLQKDLATVTDRLHTDKHASMDPRQ